MRLQYAAAVGLFLLGICANASAATYPPTCTGAKPPADVTYRGKTLREAPDITSSELRKIDAVVDASGCLGLAQQLLDVYRANHPEDYMAAYPQARIQRISGDASTAELTLRGVLREHPDFASAKVNLATILLSRDPHAAGVLIKSVLATQPNDLWANIDVLRVQVALSRNQAAIDGLLSIARDAGFPPVAREIAALDVVDSRFSSPKEIEEAYVVQLTFESITPREGKLANLAYFLIELAGRFKEGGELLVPLMNRQDHYCCEGMAHTLLAEAYLLEAASIDPKPSDKNKHLVAKAKEVLGGDLSELVPRAMPNSRLQPMLPFLQDIADPNVSNDDGETALCVAVQGISMSENRKSVQAALHLGAQTEVFCQASTPLGLLLMTGLKDPAKFDDRMAIIKMLLDHGANPNPPMMPDTNAFAYCEGSEFCKEKVLPLLKSYVAKYKSK